MQIVAFMPIRLCSKRVAGKSIRLLGGRPLFCWVLEELDQLGIPVHVYCSAPEEIQPLVDFPTKNVLFTVRPDRLDGDEVKGIEIYRQFAADVPADGYLLTHCTSPFMKAATYEKVLDPVRSGTVTCALTVRRAQTFAWYEGKPLNFSLPRIQTQRLTPVFIETSAAYCYRAGILAAGDRSDLRPHLIEIGWPEEEDIDYDNDFRRCEALVPLVRGMAENKV
jgi:CMP-N-acetylneuraminic acid synthetase